MTGLTMSKTSDISTKTFVSQKCSLRYLTLLFSVTCIVPFLCFIQKYPAETATLIFLVIIVTAVETVTVIAVIKVSML
jgi:hypothetical protein